MSNIRTKTELKVEKAQLMDELMGMSMHDERWVDVCSKRASVLVKIYTQEFRMERDGGLGDMLFTGDEAKQEDRRNGFKNMGY